MPCAELALPQKCAIGRKYGQESALHAQHLLGGFGQFCYLLPGTGIALVPSELTDDEVAPVNCGVSTMAAVTEAAAIEPGDTVAVFGAGLLGLYGVAMARVKAADHVVAIDGVAARRALACRFGADEARAPDDLEAGGAGIGMRIPSRPGGADVVIETAGVASALAAGLRFLRPGAGLLPPGSSSRTRSPLWTRARSCAAASPSEACTTTRRITSSRRSTLFGRSATACPRRVG